MCDALIEPIESVTSRWSLDTDLGPEWGNYRDRAGTVKLDQVSAIVRSLEKDGKDIPILLRHYYKLDAKFLAVGVDPNFNHTPGLLLSVSIDEMPMWCTRAPSVTATGPKRNAASSRPQTEA